jgi:hypothetical protein
MNAYDYCRSSELTLEGLKKIVTSSNVNEIFANKNDFDTDYTKAYEPDGPKMYTGSSQHMNILFAVCGNELVSVEMLKYLMDIGCYINGLGYACGWSGLNELCHNPNVNVELIKFMLDNGAEINGDYGCGARVFNTPIEILARNKFISKEIIKFILINRVKYKLSWPYNYTNYVWRRPYSTWYDILSKNENIKIICEIENEHDFDKFSGVIEGKYFNMLSLRYMLINGFMCTQKNNITMCLNIPNEIIDLQKVCKKFITLTQLLRYTICGPIILEEILNNF